MTAECASPPQENLLYTTLEQLRVDSDKGVVVALTSANPGEGVTHSVDALLSSLQKEGSRRILRVGACDLQQTSCAPAALFRCCKPIGDGIFDFKNNATPSSGVNPRHSWTDNWKYRRDCIEQLRSSFDYVLIDCPAIKAANDVLLLAPLLEGVIVVVEADKTEGEAVLQVENCLELAGGKLVGHILNKKRTSVPGWISKLYT